MFDAKRLVARRGRLSATRVVLSTLTLILWGLVPATRTEPRDAPRWAENAVISVWVDGEEAPPRAQDLVARAVRTWSDAARGHLDLRITTRRNEAQIRVHFVNDRSRYGETAPFVNRTGTIVSADVAINSSTDGDAVQQSIVLYLTALHELGHALGLAHTSDFGDMMYAFRRPGDGGRYFAAFRRKAPSIADIGSARATGLSQDDLVALRSLYGQ
jgi:hypothetical protein